MRNILLLASALSVISLSANAQYYEQPSANVVQYQPSYQSQPQSVGTNLYLKPYVGIDYSYNIVDWGDDEDGEPLDNFYADKFHAGSVSVGAKIHDNFGLEAYYKKSATAKKSDTYYGVAFKTEGELQSFGVDALFYSSRLGYDNRVELIGSVGVAWYEIKEKVYVPGFGSENEKDSHVGFRAGAGLQYYLQDNLALRFMGRYNYTGIDDAENIFELTAGVRFYF